MTAPRPIHGYENLYAIDSESSVTTLKGKSRKPYPARDGYVQILLSKDGRKRCHLVHRLMAETFIRPMKGNEVVNHLNGVTNDNRIENLEITTRSGNVLHSYRVLGQSLQRGAARPWTKLTEEQVREIRGLRAAGVPVKEVAVRFAIDAGHVSAIANRKKWSYVV